MSCERPDRLRADDPRLPDLRRILRTVIPAVETAIRADEKARTAEDIARAIETECQRTDVMVISGWGDGMADAAAIAREHAKETS